MNKLLVLMAACALAAAAPAFAADTTAAPNSQQEKMKACNAKAEGKTGDERKKFMSDCLSAKPAAAGQGGKQDGHVQPADRGAIGRRPFQGPVRMHEGVGRCASCRGAGQKVTSTVLEFVVASNGFHLKQELLNTAG